MMSYERRTSRVNLALHFALSLLKIALKKKTVKTLVCWEIHDGTKTPDVQ